MDLVIYYGIIQQSTQISQMHNREPQPGARWWVEDGARRSRGGEI